MNPSDPTLTHPSHEPAASSEAAWDAGMAAAFTAGGTASHHPATDPESGTILAGKYRLSERIGEGGMGSVWVAHQSEPVKRKVAVKLIKAGMDSKSVLARFEAERQALAVMDHPNIAKVLDGGLHDGRPFFVMELVKGVPITQYCDANKLTPKERLELFVLVCQAIQHAHQKGIIHRDIKPSNVLIALYDDKPIPKVIDFGIAKATGRALTEQTIETAFGGVVGTPQYMSPEQASLNNLDIDTRSDVYSLGVLLYELLAGSPPFAKAELEKRGLLEMLRVVREEEPPRPSTRLSTADALPSLSANRGTEPKKLTGLLRNELDWIVMKALEKDRSRRYETANGFAADINRYLAGEAVQAHPPSAVYRLKKFVRRHKVQVTAASLVLFALLAGILGTTWGLIEAKRSAEAERLAKLDADTKRAEAEKAADAERVAKLDAETQKAKAVEEKQIAMAVKEFLQKKLLEQADVRAQAYALLEAGRRAEKAKPNPTIRELLDRAAEELAEAKIEANFPNQPLLQAELLRTVGTTYRAIGEADRAIGFLKRSLVLRQKNLGPNHRDTFDVMNHLAYACLDAGEPDKAERLFKETLELRQKHLGPEDLDTLTSMNNLAASYLFDGQVAGKLDHALQLLKMTFDIRKTKLGSDHPDTLATMNNLASAYRYLGKLNEAVWLFEEALEIRKAKLGPDHPDTLLNMNNLAAVYVLAKKFHDATRLLEETLRLQKVRLGLDHPDTFVTRNNLAEAYLYDGQLDKGLQLYEEILKFKKDKFGPEHFETLAAMSILADACSRAKQVGKSISLLKELLTIQEKQFGRDDPLTLETLLNLGVSYRNSDRIEEAITLLEEVYRGAKKTRGIPMFTRAVTGELFDAYFMAGDDAKLVILFKERMPDIRKTLPKKSPELAGQLASFALSLLRTNAFKEAEQQLRECLAVREKTQPDVWTTFNTKSMLGGALLGQKKYADAEPLLLAGYEGMKAREKSIPQTGGGELRIPEALDRLIEFYTATNKPDDAKKWQAERAKYPETAPMPREKK
jgi:eukaryotic-like serine/threonine-protein kinase